MEEVPEFGAVFTFGKSKFGDETANKFWVKNDAVVAVACGDEHTAVVTTSGRSYTFGSNQWGQLALGHTNPTNKPSFVKSLKGKPVLHLACGRTHTLFATKDEVYACGANGENQVNESDASEVLSPYLIPSLSGVPVKRLSCGVEHSLILGHCGNVFLWGTGSEGQLGMGDKVNELPKPTILQFTDEKIRDASCGYYHTGLVTQSGKVFTFGESENGKLGLGESAEDESYSSPQPVFLVEAGKEICCGNTCTAVMTSSGSLYMCGDGQRGQLGFSPNTLNKCVYTLTKVPCPPIAHMSVGEGHTGVVTKSGYLYTFGDGRHGKLCHGDDNFSTLHSPHLVESFSTTATVQGVSCGGCHTMVIARPGRPVQDTCNDETKISAARTKRQMRGAKLNDTADSSSSAADKENNENIQIVQENVKSLESALGEKPEKIVRLDNNEKKGNSNKGKSEEKKGSEKKGSEKKGSEKVSKINEESEEDSGSETDVPGDSSEVTDSEAEDDSTQMDTEEPGGFMDNIMGIEDLEPAQPTLFNGNHNIIEVKSSNVALDNSAPEAKVAGNKNDKIVENNRNDKETAKEESKPKTKTLTKDSETETDEEGSEYEDETEDEEDVEEKQEEPVKTLVSETLPETIEEDIVKDPITPPVQQAESTAKEKPKKSGFWKKKPKKVAVEPDSGTQSNSKACVIL